MDWYHNELGLIYSSSPFSLGGVNYPADWLRLSTDSDRETLGFIPVTYAPRPNDKLYYVGEFVITVVDNVAHVNYAYSPRDPVDIARASAVEKINFLERSITDRMWREDAKGSTAVMDFGPEDDRTGKTASEYIAWVDDEINIQRAYL